MDQANLEQNLNSYLEKIRDQGLVNKLKQIIQQLKEENTGAPIRPRKVSFLIEYLFCLFFFLKKEFVKL